VRQADPGGRVGVLHQARAVEGVGTAGTPDVGVTDLGQRRVHRDLRGTARRAHRHGRRSRGGSDRGAGRSRGRSSSTCRCRSGRRDGRPGLRRDDGPLLRLGELVELALVVRDVLLEVRLLRGDLVEGGLRLLGRLVRLGLGLLGGVGGRGHVAHEVARVTGDGVEGAERVEELVGRVAAEQHVELGEPLAGVRGPRQLPDLTVESVEPLVRLGGVLLGGLHGGLLVGEDHLGGVELLGHDLELAAGLGDEPGGLLRGGGVDGRGAGGAGETGEGQNGGGPDEEAGADPGRAAGPGRGVGVDLLSGRGQHSVRGRHVRRLSVSSSATAYRVS
jgi:hypothetical protein